MLVANLGAKPIKALIAPPLVVEEFRGKILGVLWPWAKSDHRLPFPEALSVLRQALWRDADILASFSSLPHSKSFDSFHIILYSANMLSLCDPHLCREEEARVKRGKNLYLRRGNEEGTQMREEQINNFSSRKKYKTSYSCHTLNEPIT